MDKLTSSRFAKFLIAGTVVSVMIGAGLLNSGFGGIRGLRYVAYLGQWEAFHVVAHLLIFAGLALLTMLWVPRRYQIIAVIGVALSATVLIEGIQIITIDHPLDWDLLSRSLYDLMVNSIGTGIGFTGGQRLSRLLREKARADTQARP